MNFEPLSKRPMRVLERPTDVECLSKNPARTTPGYADESYSKEFSLSSVFYASFLDHMYRRRNEQVMAKPTNLNFMSTPISNCRNSILFIRLPRLFLDYHHWTLAHTLLSPSSFSQNLNCLQDNTITPPHISCHFFSHQVHHVWEVFARDLFQLAYRSSTNTSSLLSQQSRASLTCCTQSKGLSDMLTTGYWPYSHRFVSFHFVNWLDSCWRLRKQFPRHLELSCCWLPQLHTFKTRRGGI